MRRLIGSSSSSKCLTCSFEYRREFAAAGGTRRTLLLLLFFGFFVTGGVGVVVTTGSALLGRVVDVATRFSFLTFSFFVAVFTEPVGGEVLVDVTRGSSSSS